MLNIAVKVFKASLHAGQAFRDLESCVKRVEQVCGTIQQIVNTEVNQMVESKKAKVVQQQGDRKDVPPTSVTPVVAPCNLAMSEDEDEDDDDDEAEDAEEDGEHEHQGTCVKPTCVKPVAIKFTAIKSFSCPTPQPAHPIPLNLGMVQNLSTTYSNSAHDQQLISEDLQNTRDTAVVRTIANGIRKRMMASTESGYSSASSTTSPNKKTKLQDNSCTACNRAEANLSEMFYGVKMVTTSCCQNHICVQCVRHQASEWRSTQKKCRKKVLLMRCRICSMPEVADDHYITADDSETMYIGIFWDQVLKDCYYYSLNKGGVKEPYSWLYRGRHVLCEWLKDRNDGRLMPNFLSAPGHHHMLRDVVKNTLKRKRQKDEKLASKANQRPTPNPESSSLSPSHHPPSSVSTVDVSALSLLLSANDW